MRFFTARRLALAAALPVLLSFALIPGCSKQGEGDRCGDDLQVLDDSDCDDGLVCTAIDPNAHIYRCCNPPGRLTTNSRCIPVTTSTPTGASGASNGGGAGASSGNGGASGGEAGNAGVSGTATEAGAGGA